MIREASVEDLMELMSLLNQLSASIESDVAKLGHILGKIIQDENQYLCVFAEDGKLIGTGTLLIQRNLTHSGRPYGHIENIIIDSEYREKGFGKQIVVHLLEKAKKSECYKVILDCKKENIPFYEKCGMSATGEVQLRLDFPGKY